MAFWASINIAFLLILAILTRKTLGKLKDTQDDLAAARDLELRYEVALNDARTAELKADIGRAFEGVEGARWHGKGSNPVTDYAGVLDLASRQGKEHRVGLVLQWMSVALSTYDDIPISRWDLEWLSKALNGSSQLADSQLLARVRGRVGTLKIVEDNRTPSLKSQHHDGRPEHGQS